MNRFLIALITIYFSCLSNVSAQDVAVADIEQEAQSSVQKKTKVIDAFKIEQGIASFTQEKHFSFLSTPIKSTGVIKINQGNVLWQVNTPVFSKLLIIDNQVWQQAQIKTQYGIDEIFNKVATHASIETLINTIFTGNIDEEQWDASYKNEHCVVLNPKDNVLSKAILALELCLDEIATIRHVEITDAQKNITKIQLTQTSTTLSENDVNEFIIQ